MHDLPDLEDIGLEILLCRLPNKIQIEFVSSANKLKGQTVEVADSDEEKEDFNVLFDMEKVQQNIYEIENKLNDIIND